MTDDTAVKVVVRIRPQSPRDVADLCKICTAVVPNEPQILIGTDHSYTFDNVFDVLTTQDAIYDKCVEDLIDGCFDGYNATVLAYGQTGSGKTYTMGTGFDHSFHLDQRGIIPRALNHLFARIEEIQDTEQRNGNTPPEFKVNAQFMELYNEEVVDLLDSTRVLDNKNKKTNIKIHEDADGKIYTQGVVAKCVADAEEALGFLKAGSLSRTTASTGMNIQSSRSHAIFTLHIKQQRVVKLGKAISGAETCNSTSHKHNESLSEFETLTAKFHFVDLAGSERLKRTMATGDRQKESIHINSGLLALGNVISALGDKSLKATHVPYRDSKLTRLLQDSLGGNSRTLMIACISPSDRDFVETLSTLKYANRAKNIKNKVIANKDKSSQTISVLIKQVQSLQMELMEFKQGKRLLQEDGVECVNDMYHENTMLQSENNSLKMRIKALQETIDRLTSKNTELLVEKQSGQWIISNENGKSDMSVVIQGYISEIETLRAKLIEFEQAYYLLRKDILKAAQPSSQMSTVAITGQYDIRIEATPSVTDVLEEARKNVKRLKKKEKILKWKEKEGSIASDEEKDVGVDNEGLEDVQEEETSTSSSDTEKNEHDESLSTDLADITCDINLKEKLIKQLEISQKRLQNMKQHYEEKIALLQTKIRETEKERDKIISNLGKTAQGKSEEQRIRADYDKKITSLRNSVKKIEHAKTEHVNRFSQSAIQAENQLKKLKQEVADMKRAKIDLLNKLKEESKKHRDSELRRNKEIALLKREKLNKDTQIKALEAEKKRKEIVLKKKVEEISSLKKRNFTVTKFVSPKNISRMKAGQYQLKNAKQKWQTLENKINRLVLNKQNVFTIEKDMDHWLKEREIISRCLERVINKKNLALLKFEEPKLSQVLMELDDEIESSAANIDYIHENLSACQTTITELEDAREEVKIEDVINALNNMQLEESYYVIEKILQLAIEQSFQNSQKEVAMKELESQLTQVIENNAVQEQLLFHVVQQTNAHLSGYIEATSLKMDESVDSESDSRSHSPSIDSLSSYLRESSFVSDKPRKRKARNTAATTEELLFASQQSPDTPDTVTNDDYNQQHFANDDYKTNNDLNDKSRSYVILPALGRTLKSKSQSDECDVEDMHDISNFKPVISDHEMQSSFLKRTHTVEGHRDAVLCVECTDDVMFSGSTDGFAKIWDLASCTEIQKLNLKNPVKKICYCEYTRQAYTACATDVKWWDVRQNPALCIQHFCSTPVSRSLSADDQFTDIALNQYGVLLYCASSRSVQIWDLRMFHCVGALDMGYNSYAQCLSVSDIEYGKNRIVCGTEDKCIKVFENDESDVGLKGPKYTFPALHKDSVLSLAMMDDILFSSSADQAIKKWDLSAQQFVKSQYRAHQSKVCSLNILRNGNQLVSGCESGHMKLWSVDTFTLQEDIHAHRSRINSISSNNSLVFSAASDHTIAVWRMKTGGTTGFRILS